MGDKYKITDCIIQLLGRAKSKMIVAALDDPEQAPAAGLIDTSDQEAKRDYSLVLIASGIDRIREALGATNSAFRKLRDEHDAIMSGEKVGCRGLAHAEQEREKMKSQIWKAIAIGFSIPVLIGVIIAFLKAI